MLAMDSRHFQSPGGPAAHAHYQQQVSQPYLGYPGGPVRRVRRVPVSSCDQCRVKKMKCDAKERPHGQTCANCERYKRKCTFRDKENDMASKLQQQQLKANRPRSRSNRSSSSASLNQCDPSAWSEGSTSSRPAFHQRASFDAAQAYDHPPWLWGAGAGGQHNRSMSLPGFHQAGLQTVNGYFAVPTTLHSTPTTPEAILELLLARFYDNTSISLAVAIAPHRAEMMGRFRRSHNSPLPLYLVQVVAACAVATGWQPEPELRAWAVPAWRDAIEAVQARLSAPIAPDLDVIRALLLLTVTSAGSPAAAERLTSFQTALGLAQSLQLMSRHHNEACHPSERAQRLQVFWILYVVDKVIAVAHESTAMLPMCEMPFLAVSDMEMLGVGSDEATTAHGLALATLDLMRILETVQRDLYGAATALNFPTVASAQAIIQPLEQQLEEWCKSSRSIIAQGETPFTRRMAASVISLLHLVQLQLYSFPLRLEATLTTSGIFPITFGSANLKALVGSIESSLHLVRRGSSSSAASNRVAALTQAISKLHPATTPMTFDIFLADRGAIFLRFLSMAWAGWCDGEGVFNFVPQGQQAETTPEQPAQPTQLPATEGFAERRGSVANSGALAGASKKRAPAPLALGQSKPTSSTSHLPVINTAMVMESLGLPMTPAHRLFSELVTSTSRVATPLAQDWTSLLEQMNGEADDSAAIHVPEIQVDTAKAEDHSASADTTQSSDDISNLLGLGFDLQYPLTSPCVTTSFNFQPSTPHGFSAFPRSIGEYSANIMPGPSSQHQHQHQHSTSMSSSSATSSAIQSPSATSTWTSWDSMILTSAAEEGQKPTDQTEGAMDTLH